MVWFKREVVVVVGDEQVEGGFQEVPFVGVEVRPVPRRADPDQRFQRERFEWVDLVVGVVTHEVTSTSSRAMRLRSFLSSKVDGM